MLSRMMSDYNVEMINDGLNEFNVEFHGPKESIARLSPLSNMHFVVVDGVAIIRLWVRWGIIWIANEQLSQLAGSLKLILLCYLESPENLSLK